MSRKKPGPKARRRNPHPLDDENAEGWREGSPAEWVKVPLSAETAWIAANQLDTAERALRKSFKARRRELSCRPSETLRTATKRITGLVREVAEENADDLWWTGRRQLESVDPPVPVDRLYPLIQNPDGSWTVRYVGPDPKPGSQGPKHGAECRYRITSPPQQRYDEATRSWKAMATTARLIEEHDMASQSWKPLIALPETVDAEEWLRSVVRPTGWELKVTWPDFERDVRNHIERMLRGEKGRARREGRFAYLAYVVLGVLLNMDPGKVRALLDNYRHPRRSKTKNSAATGQRMSGTSSPSAP